MAKFYCPSCEADFDKPLVIGIAKTEEVCPTCKNKDYEWSDGYGTAEYWESAYWNLKEKHNKLLKTLRHAILDNKCTFR